MIKLKHDRYLMIATAVSSRRSKWKNTTVSWSKFLTKISETTRTHETYKAYMSMPKPEKDSIKDVGGYVAGYLRDGLRRKANMESRSMLTLDIDEGESFEWVDFLMEFDFAAAIHSTHKHCPSSPRYRLIIPLSRTVTPEEYEAVARRVAGKVGIELFDPSTFEPERLMYWPSTSKDGEYVFEYSDAPFLVPDDILAEYHDWHDISEWCYHEAHLESARKRQEKAEDPTTKTGLIGAFCRCYDIHEAIESFLSDVYEPASNGRYTYIKGSTANGVLTYEDKFAFSHHGTDPAGGQLRNAYDLVRIHKFGELDPNAEYVPGKSPSEKAMIDFVQSDEKVRKESVEARIKGANLDFVDEEGREEIEGALEEDAEWRSKLEIDKSGVIKSSAPNISLILTNDPLLKGRFAYNQFDNKRYLMKSVPWRKITSPEPVKEVEYAGVRSYLESVYGIVATQKIEDGLTLEFNKNAFHPIRDYLTSLKWDGVERIDTLLIDYLGAEDTQYTREAMRVTLLGAVSRVMEPGCKFDTALVLVGGEGTTKSSFFYGLGMRWFSDTFLTVDGTKAFEQLQGAWIVEMAELSSLKKAEVESVKHFLTKRSDEFRPAYQRTKETFPRQNIFVGTTNEWSFLRDDTGNRRFLPIAVRPEHRTKRVYADGIKGFAPEFKDAIDQIWAEAYMMWEIGYPTILSPEAEAEAKSIREDHREVDDRTGLITDYVNMPIPEDWDKMSVSDRINYKYNEQAQAEATGKRMTISAAEIWIECLERPMADMNNFNTKPIHSVLKNLPGWERQPWKKVVPKYGSQVIYKRLKL